MNQMQGLLSDIKYTPSRKPSKFEHTNYSRHFLYLDSAISREDRQILYMEIFACARSLVGESVPPEFTIPPYAPEEYLELRVINDHLHPAYGQVGLFAKRNIPSNTVVTSYSGFIEVFGSSCNSRTYTMGFGNIGDDFALDAEFAGNYGRFANDPRGVIGLTANILAENRFNSRGECFTALVSKRQITEGEEILMAYGKAHNLCNSPWMDATDRFLLRYRSGGMMPSAFFRRDSFSYELMWECAQCGMWSNGDHRHLDLKFCGNCRAPQITGTPLVGAARISSVTDNNKGGAQKRPCNSSDSNSVSHENAASTGTGDDSLIASSAVYSAVKVNWPGCVPFLPWQVWDPSVPIHTVLQHSRFETQENLLVYTVTPFLDDNASVDGCPDKDDLSYRCRKRGRRSISCEARECDTLPPSHSPFPSRDERDVKKRGEMSQSYTSLGFPTASVRSLLDTSNLIDRFLVLSGSREQCAIALRKFLLRIDRRIYAGKSFNKGDVIGYVGGVIRPLTDSRCNPSNSSLVIPMKYFIPSAWRNSVAVADDKQDDMKALAQRDLVCRLRELAFVVTNEMMYCPVVTFEKGDDVKSEEAQSLVLQEANSVFVLTVDALGCPFVACLAIRQLSPFNLLLATI